MFMSFCFSSLNLLSEEQLENCSRGSLQARKWDESVHDNSKNFSHSSMLEFEPDEGVDR
jgi:hypothetical protein